MNFDLLPEQVALGDAVRGLLKAHATPANARQLWASDTGRDPELWRRLAEMGIAAILVPEHFGGLGRDELDLLLVLEQIGRVALPDAILESCVLAPFLIAGSVSKKLQQRWLPRMATGEVRVTVGLGDSGLVPDVLASDLVLLEVAGEVVALERDDLVATPLSSMDPSRRISIVNPLPGAGEPLIGADLGGAHVRSLVGSAAVLNGLGARLIEMTVEYAKVRTQFGRPIGSFQAVKHELAHAASLNGLSRWATAAAVYSVARAREDGTDAATLAHVCAVEAEAEANRVALQVHGGVGFTWEYDLQLWLKRGKVLEQAYGAERDLAERAGRAGLDVSTALCAV